MPHTQEGGSFRPNCDYRVLPMSYVERDDGPDRVATRPFAFLNRTYQYMNRFEYDGETMHDQYFFTPILPWTQRTQSLDPRLPHPELGEAVFPETYLGSDPDGLEHALTLRLDTTGENKTAGEIRLRYCGFDGFDCGCRPDLDGGDGVYVGDRLLHWGTDDNCVFMSDVRTLRSSSSSSPLPNPYVHATPKPRSRGLGPPPRNVSFVVQDVCVPQVHILNEAEEPKWVPHAREPDTSTSQRDAAITPGPSITALLSIRTAVLPRSLELTTWGCFCLVFVQRARTHTAGDGPHDAHLGGDAGPAHRWQYHRAAAERHLHAAGAAEHRGARGVRGGR